MQTVIPYKITKRGKPPIRPEPTKSSLSKDSQCKRSIIHVLTCADWNGDCPAVTEQAILSFGGFCANLSKAYFHMSYNQSPNKSVINDIMNKLTNIITVKHMPFAFLVGDLPSLSLCSRLKIQWSTTTLCPFLVHSIHSAQWWVLRIFKHFNGSDLEDVLVACGVIADGSVDQALKGKHFKRGLCCLKLMYEALMSQLVKERLIPYLHGKQNKR